MSVEGLRLAAGAAGSRAELRRAAQACPPLTLMELDGLFREGSELDRLAALEHCLARRQEWGKRWGGLFLRWARSEASPALSDELGAKFIGPLWLAGEIEARQLAALALSSRLASWRAGLAALGPSLERDGRDWPLFERFAKACLTEGASFQGQRAAYSALFKALRRAVRAGRPEARDWLERHELVLPGGEPEAPND